MEVRDFARGGPQLLLPQGKPTRKSAVECFSKMFHSIRRTRKREHAPSVIAVHFLNEMSAFAPRHSRVSDFRRWACRSSIFSAIPFGPSFSPARTAPRQ